MKFSINFLYCTRSRFLRRVYPLFWPIFFLFWLPIELFKVCFQAILLHSGIFCLSGGQTMWQWRYNPFALPPGGSMWGTKGQKKVIFRLNVLIRTTLHNMYVYMYIVHNLHFVYQENITEVLYCCNQTWTSVIPPWKSQTLISPKKRYKLFEIINLNFFGTQKYF